MKRIIFTASLLLIGLAGMTQTKQLIADETTITRLKTSNKIETSNTTIFKAICEAFNKQEGFRYTATIKRDRQGLYTLYSVSIKDADMPKIERMFNIKAK